MSSVMNKLALMSALFCLALLANEPAHAFRCGSRIVIEGMHEVQVRAACGEPMSTRQIGYAIRAYIPRGRRNSGISISSRYGYPGYQQQVIVTEFVYNFGPRKLLRILRFEGGILTYIETAGYGYLEN